MTQKLEPDHQRMDELIAGLGDNKSAKIRRLAAAGYARGDIARYLGIRYQFVYNVLSASALRAEAVSEGSTEGTARGAKPAPTIVSGDEATKPAAAAPGWVWTRVRKGGAIDLPPTFLQAMGVGEGDQVQLALEGDVVRVLNRSAVLRELQEEVRRYVPEGVSLVDELLAERRAETAEEMEDEKIG